VRGGVAIRGVGSITVPGAVSAWRTLAERWGTLPLARALEGAAALALDGVPVAPALARKLDADPGLVMADSGLQGVFAPGGRVLGEGDLLVQERLGRTLQRLAAHGADDFYRGETAARLIAGLRERGSQLSLADLDAHPMVGCHHVRLDDDHHVLFEGEAVARAARQTSCSTTGVSLRIGIIRP